MKEKKALKLGIAAVCLVVAVAAFLIVYNVFSAKPAEGAKTITVTIADLETSEVFTIRTDAEFLAEALLAEDLVAGMESEYGLFIETANGITANADDQEWWCITKGGEDVFTGASATPIYDGDAFELTLTVGW
ncbi:MAG: hypothetical protein NC084_10080 [Bacteroides sp.]|nr:hypothetical protein [Roseburia sp.]MCM1463047.1 hypothetical protein [Bacteroides sp.]